MSLQPGSQLAAYEIRALIGRGGMGEVYRAHDTKLNRDVALKVLPTAFTHDPDRVARFRREAHVLASLNHPHIAAIYGLDEAGDTQFLVLELVEGPTLADRIARGPVPLPEALLIAQQVAEALTSAHEKGIIHRDLKPANIALTGNGQVKVLDFGLAKALEPEGSDADPANSPTIATPQMTRLGTILGTAAYMSPEQARGLPIDRRADIWAFGCVLYEMITGRPPFAGGTVPDVIVAILEREPDFRSLPPHTPPSIRRLLHRCLRKDPRQRLHHFADVRLELDDPFEPAGTNRQSPPLRWALASIGIALLIVAAVALFLDFRGTPSPPAPLRSARFTVIAPADLTFREMAIAPNGHQIAFITIDRAARTQLWIRRIDDTQLSRIPGVENPSSPIWSPDGEHLAFFMENKLLKIRIGDPLPTAIADVHAARVDLRPGGSWGPDGTILYSDDDGVIRAIAAEGGAAWTVVERERGARDLWPEFLPDGRRFLFVREAGSGLTLNLGSLDSSDIVRIGEIGSRFAPLQGDQVVYQEGYDLVTRALNSSATLFDGPPVTIASGIALSRGYPTFDGSDEALVFLTPPLTQLQWVDRTGRTMASITGPGDDASPALSPDETRLAVTRVDAKTKRPSIFTIDLATGQSSQLTVGSASTTPVWSPDGLRIAFNRLSADTDGSFFHKPVTGGGKEEQVVTRGRGLVDPCGWTSSGIVLYRAFPRLGLVSVEGKAVEGIDTIDTQTFDECGAISPDNRWMVYQVFRRGLWLVEFPSMANARSLTNGRISIPSWRRDGRELYFVNLDTADLMSVTIDSTGRAGTPQRLFGMTGITYLGGSVIRIDPNLLHYAPSGDGQRFVVRRLIDPLAAGSATVVTNWRRLSG